MIEDFFAMLSRPHLKLPRVFVLPDSKLGMVMAIFVPAKGAA